MMTWTGFRVITPSVDFSIASACILFLGLYSTDGQRATTDDPATPESLGINCARMPSNCTLLPNFRPNVVIVSDPYFFDL